MYTYVTYGKIYKSDAGEAGVAAGVHSRRARARCWFNRAGYVSSGNEAEQQDVSEDHRIRTLEGGL